MSGQGQYRKRSCPVSAAQSTLTLAALIIGHHFAISAFCQAPSASGVSLSFWRHLQAKIFELLAHRRIVQRINVRGDEPGGPASSSVEGDSTRTLELFGFHSPRLRAFVAQR